MQRVGSGRNLFLLTLGSTWSFRVRGYCYSMFCDQIAWTTHEDIASSECTVFFCFVFFCWHSFMTSLRYSSDIASQRLFVIRVSKWKKILYSCCQQSSLCWPKVSVFVSCIWNKSDWRSYSLCLENAQIKLLKQVLTNILLCVMFLCCVEGFQTQPFGVAAVWEACDEKQISLFTWLQYNYILY